ncbi:MAG: enoyl-CoA hydratase/isomerase family protein [Chloroflexi bacterium]|nr:enoyl-CoA hydratase/isomerase family protein [Chloroflexota bacterium]
MMDRPAVSYRKEGPVAWLTLDRPHVLNAYNLAMRDDLYAALEAVRDDPDVRGVILCGAGDRAFCAGADLTEFGTAPSQAIARQVRWERDVWGLFLCLDKPVIAALHGFVLGSGVEMALLCDLRIAADDAVFGLPETALGMVPAAGGTQTLPRAIGPSRALELLLTGKRISAQEAMDIGLVAEVTPRPQLLNRCHMIMSRILEAESEALANAKRAVREGIDLPLRQALQQEELLAARLLAGKRKRLRYAPSPKEKHPPAPSRAGPDTAAA